MTKKIIMLLWMICLCLPGIIFAAPVRRIISSLHLLKDGHGMDIAVGGAAQWSLASNAVQHRRVYEICREELKKSDGSTKEMLEEIIAKAQAQE